MNNTRAALALLAALAALASLAALAALALAGCATSPPGGGAGPTAFSGKAIPTASRATLLAVDRSKSTEEIRSQLLTTTFDIGTNFDSTHDTMRLYRFGRNIEEVYAGLPEDDDAFASLLAKYMKDSDPALGTDYPRVFETLAAAAANAPQSEIRIVVVGDGLNDFANDPESEKCYREAVKRLAHNPHVKWVRFWGVGVGPREEIRSVFKSLGSRLQILSLDQNPLAP